MQFIPRDIPSSASMFSTYVSLMGYITMFNQMVNTFIPLWFQNFVVSYLKSFVGSSSPSSTLTLVVDQLPLSARHIPDQLYDVVLSYLSSKTNSDAARLKMVREPDGKNVKLYLTNGAVVPDVYKGVKLTWRMLVNEKIPFEESFELSFDKKHRDLVLNSYIPYVESQGKVIKNKSRILKMHSYNHMERGWVSVKFEHPSTFESMAMNKELKRSVMEDLDRFIKRKDFYKRVGKAWKRGYLLYGPPGTGKTSLVAAMANYLGFDIYDLQLASVQGDADLRSLLLRTKNSSIFLVEDIDCSVDLPTRLQPSTMNPLGAPKGSTTLTLSGLLNCIDGLWSSCGAERILIFTTNNKDKLDPALLRPGRMDMHIYMGHCCFDGFKTLAFNYLGLSDENDDDTHRLYPEIKELIDGKVLTPAQVAEELLKFEDADMALEGLVNVLKRKRSEPNDESTKRMNESEEEGEKKYPTLMRHQRHKCS